MANPASRLYRLMKILADAQRQLPGSSSRLTVWQAVFDTEDFWRILRALHYVNMDVERLVALLEEDEDAGTDELRYLDELRGIIAPDCLGRQSIQRPSDSLLIMLKSLGRDRYFKDAEDIDPARIEALRAQIEAIDTGGNDIIDSIVRDMLEALDIFHMTNYAVMEETLEAIVGRMVIHKKRLQEEGAPVEAVINAIREFTELVKAVRPIAGLLGSISSLLTLK